MRRGEESEDKATVGRVDGGRGMTRVDLRHGLSPFEVDIRAENYSERVWTVLRRLVRKLRTKRIVYGGVRTHRTSTRRGEDKK